MKSRLDTDWGAAVFHDRARAFAQDSTFHPSAIRVGCASIMPDATVHTDSRVIEHLNGPLYRVALPNGKNILAHLSKPLADQGVEFLVGETLRLELTPYDFDQARILGRMD